MRLPTTLELRYFRSLEDQPILLNLGATAEPPMPKLLPEVYDSFGFAGSKFHLFVADHYFVSGRPAFNVLISEGLSLCLCSSAPPIILCDIGTFLNQCFYLFADFTTQQLSQALTAIGLDYNTVNFNSTPPQL
jgi:hypothetical protein